MDFNEQRDYAEEQYNKAEMERESMAELEYERSLIGEDAYLDASYEDMLPLDGPDEIYYIDDDPECDIDCTCLFCIPGF